jgi:uncharacterized protein YbaP (TraB family)
MKNKLMIIFILSAAIAGKTQESLTGSLFWEITGKKLKAPSYLFGTIHIQDKKVFNYDPLVEEKLITCKAFAMEMLVDEVNRIEMKDAILMKDSTLDILLNKNDYKKLDSFFREKMGISINFFNKTKPFFISAELAGVYSTSDMPEPLDIHLLNIAKANGKKVFGIETFEEQVATVDKIPLKEQAQMLVKSIEDTMNVEKLYDELLNTYLNADLEKMIKLSKDPSLPLHFSKIFVDERNIRMAGRIAEFAIKQSVFCAVGAAHLGGENGIIAMLRKKGFTVNPVIL